MKFKVDENLPREAAELLCSAGHDAITVADQGLSGEQDSQIIQICRSEDRALITLDLDFADVRSYPPKDSAGLVVLRLRQQDKPHVLKTLARVLPLFAGEVVENRLWIVEETRVRIRDESD